jgi:DNA-binding HxlR family transcriptional regulator
LQHKLAGISPKVLTQTLRRLENSGFVDRTVFPEVPLHVESAPWRGLLAAVRR